MGCVWAQEDCHPEFETKEIIGPGVGDLKLLADERKLLEWMSLYYHYSLGQLIDDILPSPLKKLPTITQQKKVVNREPPPLNQDQKKIADNIIAHLGGFKSHLIHGITGSGKSRIYLEAIKEVTQRGQDVLYLLPEINLTPQFIEFFTDALDVEVVVYHSEISKGQKFQAWKHCSQSERPTLVIGVRSAVFLPLNKLGLIIIDEEHDTSFKQDDRCPYHARDVAFKKAQIANSTLVLGSATPSLETYYYFTKNQGPKIFYYQLHQRAAGGELPEVVLLDCREKQKSNPLWPLNQEMIETTKQALQEGEQIIFYVNRLGYANYLQCRACGHQFKCPNCEVTLRYFKAKELLQCQHCNYQESIHPQCPSCLSLSFVNKGYGTEKIQEQLRSALSAQIERFDREEIKNFKQLQKTLNDFKNQKIDVLVGTQMIAKGHNFERVKKVFILGIDQQLNFPDFRSEERVFQSLVQVSGRAGRFSRGGRVYIQTYDPESSLLKLIQSHQYLKFYEHELKIREHCHCPPFYRLASIFFTHKNQAKLVSHLEKEFQPLVFGLQKKLNNSVQILGPRPAIIEKRSNQYTWTCLIKSSEAKNLHQFIEALLHNYVKPSGISLKVDIDPQHLG